MEDFHRRSSSKDGRSYICKPCALAATTEWRLQNHERHKAKLRQWHQANKGRKYGVTPDQYQAMSQEAGGRCAICGRSPVGKRKHLVVDHDHATGQVRKLICHPCNSGLGLFQDDPGRLEAAAAYIRAHQRAEAPQ